MRKFTVILLLTALTTGQYAKQLSYWQCRLMNIVRTDLARCDCDKLIVQSNPSKQPALPISHNHTHIQLDDLYDHAHVAMGHRFSDADNSPKVQRQPSLLTGVNRTIDRPG
jgi:hypothetical protein